MIAAVVLAAGLSRRMGRQKLALPWGDSTVIGQVVGTLVRAEVSEIVVVTGGAQQEIQNALLGQSVRLVFNPEYANGEMLRSIQVGLGALGADVGSALIALGDQPQIQEEVVRGLVEVAREGRARLVVPSYRMRRGHPWCVSRALWREILVMGAPATMRDFLDAHGDEVYYYPVETDSILLDLDTPEDYVQYHPRY